MHCHCCTNNRAPRWTFTDPCTPEVRPGAWEESVSPAWLAAPAMNAHNTTKVYIWRLDIGCGPTLHRKCHNHNTTGKAIITLEPNPSRGTVLPAPHGKGNKWDKKCKIQKNWCTVTVAPTIIIEHHGGPLRTPEHQRWDQVPGRSQRLLLD